MEIIHNARINKRVGTMTKESVLNITYLPGITKKQLVDTITLNENNYFTVKELKEALNYFDEDTPVYVSNSNGGNLCRMISHEPDGTITLSHNGGERD